MRKNKIGVAFMVSVLALAGIGLTYAGWTDTILVSGTVQNGDVDIDVVAYSGTWIWKTVSDHGLIRHHEFSVEPDYHVDPTGWTGDDLYENGGDYMLVSSAWAETGNDPIDPDHDTVCCVFDNLFPCQDFTIDFVLHYDGSIPAQINGPILIDTCADFDDNGNPIGELPTDFKGSGYNWLEYLWYVENQDGIDNGGIDAKAYRIYDTEDDGWDFDDIAYDEPVGIGYQLHNCNYVYVELTIHIPQDDDYQGLSGGFYTGLEVIQFDEGPAYQE